MRAGVAHREEGMAAHPRILAWRIPWTEEPGGPQSMGSQRVGHDGLTKHSTLAAEQLWTPVVSGKADSQTQQGTLFRGGGVCLPVPGAAPALISLNKHNPKGHPRWPARS